MAPDRFAVTTSLGEGSDARSDGRGRWPVAGGLEAARRGSAAESTERGLATEPGGAGTAPRDRRAYRRSKRSTGSMKTVAPPTSTSSG